MKIPSFIKAIIGCTDRDSSRYALGAVKLENKDGVSHAIATDGRQLLEVSWSERLDAPVDTMLDGESLRKAAQVSQKKGKPTVFVPVDADTVMVKGGGGTGVATVLKEGRYPRWRDVFPSFPDTASDRFQINLCPELLSQLLAVYQQAGCASVRFWFSDAQSGVLMAAKATTGETIRAVLMPKEIDDANRDYPSGADAAPVTEPEAVAV